MGNFWFKWLPWRYLIRKAALSHGFLDPISLLSHLHRFSQPSEVNEPVELLRAGAVFHARGLINTKIIQHNLDWVWPYWVRKQFDPHDDSFIPRAFSMTHVNLTHRNWTAIGLPDMEDWPIVDPAGLCTPTWDGWSLDAWIIGEDGSELIPCHMDDISQKLQIADNLSVITEVENSYFKLRTTQYVPDRTSICKMEVEAYSSIAADIVFSIRPYNPEGISFIHNIKYDQQLNTWLIDDNHKVVLSESPYSITLSRYIAGDVYYTLRNLPQQNSSKNEITCDVGLATSAASFKIAANETRSFSAVVMQKERNYDNSSNHNTETSWEDALNESDCKLVLNYGRFQEIFDAAVRTLILLSPDDTYPGPYTYKRFWFRDATFILNSLICLGFTQRARRVIDRFWHRQTALGYFLSQEGEWDSNGEVLWILQQYLERTAQSVPEKWIKPITSAAQWICRKRLSKLPESPHAGLLPAGFSAEHLGPNDYYYWDDFWALAGLQSAAQLLKDNPSHVKRFTDEADCLKQCIDKSLKFCEARMQNQAIPASPYRRMDSGAIGSVVAGYPLQVVLPNDPRLNATIEFLLEHCFVKGGFYQDMIHSGINPYLTLHVAQVLLRARDSRFEDAITAVADLASSTCQWPEAIHPRTNGGCMGDGQHAWAAAEWLMMIRNCFVREESERIILASGVANAWLSETSEASFGPTLTKWGSISVTVKAIGDAVEVSWIGNWHLEEPIIEVAPPSKNSMVAAPGTTSATVQSESRH